MDSESVTNDPGAALIYQKLDSNSDEIRLLTLHPTESPDSPDSPVRCTLSHASLSSCPDYETVSYVWGEHVFDSPILLEEHDFYVTSNLASILRYLRRNCEPRLLWVDALCINQQDLQERSRQVSLMRTIFSKCKQALAWLGPDAKLFQGDRDRLQQKLIEGMTLMWQIGSRDVEILRKAEDEYAMIAKKKGLGAEVGPQRAKGMILSDDGSWALGQLFEYAKFWSRAWVVQELACAPRVILLCEGAELDWRLVSTFLRDQPYSDAFHYTFSHSTRLNKSLQYVFRAPLQIEHQRWISQEFSLTKETTSAQKSTLLDVLARFREKKSSDPRDKVYALLGLVSENHGIVADYSKSVDQLFQEVTVSVINGSRNLDIICQNPFEPRNPDSLRDHLPGLTVAESGQSSLPSWVADLRLDGMNLLFAQRNIFNASKTSCSTPCRLLGDREQVLMLRGYKIDRVGPILQDNGSNASIRETMFMYLGKHVIEQSDTQYYKHRSLKVACGETKPPESTLRAYWRTLLKDCTRPPRMRRLDDAEITQLGIKNESMLRSRGQRDDTLFSYMSTAKSAPRATSESFPRLEDDGELAIDQDTSYRLRHRLDEPGQDEDLEEREFDPNFMFTITKNGVFVLVRKQARQGDILVVLEGAKVPLLLRQVEKRDIQGAHEIEEAYRVIGPAYAHGFMDGEVEERLDEGWISKEDFALV